MVMDGLMSALSRHRLRDPGGHFHWYSDDTHFVMVDVPTLMITLKARLSTVKNWTSQNVLLLFWSLALLKVNINLIK